MQKYHGENVREVTEFVLKVGQVLLKNGAEIIRVEETIERICRYYEIESVDTLY